MAGKRGETKRSLIRATVGIVAEEGVGAATIDAIARRVGITQGAIYRHYRSKDDLRWDAYRQIVEEMITEKDHLLTSETSVRDRLREWIRLTFEYFDRDPEAFTYVFLVPHTRVPECHQEITWRQSELFLRMIRQGQATHEIRRISPELALCHFTGLMLNVPRLINEGVLQRPAIDYVDEITGMVWRVLGANPPGQGTTPESAERTTPSATDCP
jgi:AcrR family transcriptional regulator